MDSLWRDIPRDLRHGLRLMWQTPVISLAAILSLALGTGANTAIFSLLDALVFRDLPVHAPQDLLVLKWSVRSMPRSFSNYGTNDRINGRTVNWSFTPPLFEALRKPSAAVAGVAAFNDTQSSSLIVRGQAVKVSGNFVSGDFFEVAGVSPYAGRLITSDDDRPEAPPAVVIGYRLWKDRFAGELSAISEIVQINGHAFTVIGIAPPEFNGVSEDRPDFYVPVATQPLVYPTLQQGRDPNLFWLQLVARKRPEASREQAQSALNTVFLQNFPSQNLTAAETPTLDADPGSQGYDFLRRRYSQPLWVLMTLVGLLLLIACTNIANLLLARGAARHNENAIRAALGAGRARLMRQYLTESLLLAITGGVAGLLVAKLMRDLLLTFLPAGSRLALEAQLDWRVFGFTLTISLLTGFLFGLAPAWKAARIDPGPALAMGPRIVSSGWGGGGWRRLDAGRLLVLGQVALSLMLLVAGGLFLGSLRRLQQTRLGFNPENLLLFRVNAVQAGHKDNVDRFYASMIERISSLRGVRSATYSLYAMIGGGSWATSGLRIIGQPPLDRDLRNTRVLPVGPKFFETMEIPLLVGRLFNERDQANSGKVAVVNERWVRLYVPNTSPIGHKFTMNRNQTDTVEVVGVVRNARYNTLQGDEPAITYLPFAQTPNMYSRDANFAIRSSGAPESIIPSVRQAVRSLDANLPVSAVRTQIDQINTHLQQQRVFAMLSVCFAALAALLAAIGLYGVMAYAVSRRTSEIGVRMAFGATRGNVAWLILRDVSAVLAAGIAVGIAGAIGTSTLVESSLYQVAPTDPPTIVAAAVLMAVVAIAAGYFPARRAARLDPMTALRHE